MPPHGGYSLVVEPRFVEPIVRVRFPVAAQIARPAHESVRVVGVWSGYRESNGGAGDPLGRRAASSVLNERSEFRKSGTIPGSRPNKKINKMSPKQGTLWF